MEVLSLNFLYVDITTRTSLKINTRKRFKLFPKDEYANKMRLQVNWKSLVFDCEKYTCKIKKIQRRKLEIVRSKVG